MKQRSLGLQDGHMIHRVLCYCADLSNSYMVLSQFHNLIYGLGHIITGRSVIVQNTENSNRTDYLKCNYIKCNQFLLL
jgi:hypothetical protein